jgi:demethylmenaquinone methyltransferase/2-methoxy-6-polyprenyl-1,4-benzoquinol methylase
MFDHFGLLAPFYERVIPPPDVDQLCGFLELPAQGNLLDAGGGTGRVSAQLEHLVDKLVITDSSAGMLAQARQKKKLRVYQSHSEKLPFANESFERVLVVDALHHFANQKEAIAELARVLKRGGIMVIEEPNIEHFRVKLIALAEKIALMQSHFLSPLEIQDELLRYDLKTRIEKDSQFTAWVIAEKVV